MATKHTDTCLEKAADDEPIFVLRAQDKHAPAIVREWAARFKSHIMPPGGSIENNLRYNNQIAKYQEAMALADKMETWPTRKLPD